MMADKLIPHWVLDTRESLMNLWDTWGIQTLVISSISFQIILTLLGNRRKQVIGLLGIGMRSVLWVTYLFATEVVPYSLGKLSGLRIDNSLLNITGNSTFVDSLLNITGNSTFIGADYLYSNVVETLREKELKALLAPLLLLQLGYPDNITAYSMEDNQLGLRQVLNMTIIVTVVAGILVRCWNPTNFVILYCPMFLAGIVKYAEGVWALKFALGLNASLTSKDTVQDKMTREYMEHLPGGIEDLKLLVKAYCRFDCLKPHLESWIYHPSFVSHELLSIDCCSPQEAFKITEIELGFMYDVLYTKAPVIYTKLGFVVRLISFFLLFITVCGFRDIAMPIPSAELEGSNYYNFLFRPQVSSYTSFTFSVLLLVLFLELYQILLLPYSEWMIVKMSKRSNWPLALPFLRFLTPRAVHKWRRWSNSLDQFNMLEYCLRVRKDWTRYIKFLKCWGIYVYIKRNWSLNRMGPTTLPEHMKEKTVKQQKIFEEDRGTDPFNERGRWTIKRYKADELEWSIKKAFDKNIVTWHLATNICYYLDNHKPADTDNRLGSKLLSDYMMYLLVIHPSMLSATTGNIVFTHAYSKIKEILKQSNRTIATERELAESIFKAPQRSDSMGSGNNQQHQTAVVTSNWHVISDVQRLANSLMGRDDKWELISSMWMEMLCYGAASCQLSHHAAQLRRGGEFITLVWLLLAHTTDRLNP